MKDYLTVEEALNVLFGKENTHEEIYNLIHPQNVFEVAKTLAEYIAFSKDMKLSLGNLSSIVGFVGCDVHLNSLLLRLNEAQQNEIWHIVTKTYSN